MSDAALDLRVSELGIVVPLVALLLALSAWPNAVSGHSFSAPTAFASSTFELAAGSVNPASSQALDHSVESTRCTVSRLPIPTDLLHASSGKLGVAAPEIVGRDCQISEARP